MKILIVEDDPLILELLREMVELWGYVSDEATDGETALEMAKQISYDLLLLDLNLPKLDGMTVCRRLRQSLERQPLILMLTARDTKFDKMAGLEEGADDYMVKPFDPEMLHVRVKALLRRVDRPLQAGWHWGQLHLERDSHGADYAGLELKLTAKEYLILEALMQADGRTCSKDRLLQAAWGWAEIPGEESLKTHIKNLRAKLMALGAPADLLETVYGVGFRLNPCHTS